MATKRIRRKSLSLAVLVQKLGRREMNAFSKKAKKTAQIISISIISV
jgi:hypothetical protein